MSLPGAFVRIRTQPRHRRYQGRRRRSCRVRHRQDRRHTRDRSRYRQRSRRHCSQSERRDWSSFGGNRLGPAATAQHSQLEQWRHRRQMQLLEVSISPRGKGSATCTVVCLFALAT